MNRMIYTPEVVEVKIAICDDEKQIRLYIAKCVSEICPEAEISEYPKADEIISKYFDADILFLDIRMPGMDGMKAARILRTLGRSTIIIFVTAAKEYVFQAFDVGAVQYILKPFEKDKLVQTIKKALTLAKEKKEVETLLSGDNEGSTPKTFWINYHGSKMRVVLSDIAYAEVFDRQIMLHMKDNSSLEYYGKMSELEGITGEDFFRIHRAYLINLGLLSSYNSKTVTICEAELPIARGKYNELVKAYLAYVTREERM